MNRLFRTTVIETSGVRTIAGGGTNASSAGQALLNLSGVSITGNQTISGIKTFATGIVSPLRIGNPGDVSYAKVQLWETSSESYQSIGSVDGGFTFSREPGNQINLEFSSEYISLSHQAGGSYRFLSGYEGTVPINAHVVHVTGGNETISGIKTFSTQILVNNIRPILTGTPLVLNPLYIDVYDGILGHYTEFGPWHGLNWNSGIISSNNGAEGWRFTKRPTVNGTGVLLSGEAINPLVSIDNITGSFNFLSTHNGKVLYVSGNTDITGTLPLFGIGLNAFSTGYNVSVVQVGSGNVIFNNGGVNGAYFRNRLNLNKTAGKYAVASVLRLDQNEFLLYGDLV